MPQHPPTPTWNHPLFGADPLTLLAALACNRPFSAGVRPLAGAMVVAALLRAPASLCEHAWTVAGLRRLPPPRSPVFILGHWRSGTTHLFNLLSRDPAFAWPDPFAAGLPWDFRILGRLARPLMKRALPENRYIDDVAVDPDSPQEDEIALASMQNVSYYHAVYFPRRFESWYRRGVFLEGVSDRHLARWRRRFEYYHGKLLAARPGATLLVKNPVYTGRVALIRRIWPDARFIHIHRNPYVVFESTRKFHRALLRRFALQGFDEDIAEQFIEVTYPRMIENLYADVADLGSDRFVELSFDSLEDEPLAQLERIYTSLGLPGFPEMYPEFQAYLDSVAHYRKSGHVFTKETIDRVDRHWDGLVRRWSYSPPKDGHPR
ncbi:MAG: sulfotransferase [Gammaproteobacteria bacterium]|nr:sulfotransferase [Gammaproteobacteria bacterium]